MKKGSGSDPFAEVQEEAESADAESETTEETPATDESESDPEPEQPVTEDADSRVESETDTDRDDESTADSSAEIIDEPPQNGADDGGVPWVYVRDTVKQDREMVQFYLRDYVVDAEDEFVDAVSDELGTDVSKTDVREAAYEAAMHNVDEVVDRLEAWGFESED
ncbi:hypothetical protein [Natrinema versiforme]|uniref:Uncharacterized protein n=1 Tax=Natrinema versiforme JCM 10478 TaxID=1227496 RepID=L9XN15_9EURY|nr:hypothetical protein [Natrinema versiforme]ELY63189.1 hypothetical protein C489_20286 [Natrinema versiforme JCM 10478]